MENESVPFIESIGSSKSAKAYICENFYKSLQRDKTFSILIHLFTHESYPDGGKQIEFSDCHKLFLTSSCLKAHKRSHGGERPLTCSHCENTFTQLIYTKKNMQTSYANDSVHAFFTCSQCDESFEEASHLKLHMKVHTREKLFKCNNCERSLTDPV